MKRPAKAVVLAAGLGTRLRPLSETLPKPLWPLWNTPMLFRSLERLRSWGVREALINLHHGADRIAEAVLARPVPGLRIAFSFEPEVLGTGGALIRGRWFLGSEPFWMVNADVVAELDPEPLLAAMRRDRPLATWWVEPARGPRTVGLDGQWVAEFSVARPGSPGTVTFTGLQLVHPRVLDWLPREERFCSILDPYRAAMQQGERIRAVALPGAFWADVGTPEQYLAAHREHAAGAGRAEARREVRRLARRGAVVQGFASADPAASVSPGAVLRDSVVLAGATICPNAALSGAIAAPGVELAGPVSHLTVPAPSLLGAAEQRILARWGWPAGRTAAEVLPARGSARAYFRLHDGAASAVLVRYREERPENALFARQARFLHRLGLPVPRILGEDRRAGLVLQEDGGADDLLGFIVERRGDPLPWYERTLEAAARLHERGLPEARRCRLPLMPGFDAALYRWEHDLLRTHLLEKVRPEGVPAWRHLRRELEEIAGALLAQPAALIHRDLQSSNVLLRGGAVLLIDFQGMRAGAAAYDVASLLYDPYADLDPATQQRLLQRYRQLRGLPDAFDHVLPLAAVQRLVQALGAYGRLSALPGCARFAAYIPPALAQLRRALAPPGRFPALGELADALTAASARGILNSPL